MYNQYHEKKIQNVMQYILLNSKLDINNNLLDEYISELCMDDFDKQRLKSYINKDVKKYKKIYTFKNKKMCERFIATTILVYLCDVRKVK